MKSLHVRLEKRRFRSWLPSESWLTLIGGTLSASKTGLGGVPMGSVAAGEVVIRYLFGFVGEETVVRGLVLGMMLAGLGTLAQSASAQEEEISSESAPDEPALQLKLDSAGIEAEPRAPRTGDGYTLKEMELRVKRAKIGLWSTAGATVLGGVLIGTWVGCEARAEPTDEALLACGGVLMSGVSIGFSGAVGMIVTGALLGVRKRNLRELKQAHYGRPRRAHWDLARSLVVF